MHVAPSVLVPAASASFSRSVRIVSLVGALLCQTACGTVQVREDAGGGAPAPTGADAQSAGDPFEGFNRAMYTFNDKLDRYVLKPVAKGYRAVLPEVARKGVSNFFGNLHDPGIMVNNLLQGKFTQAASDLGRFLVNSTVGIVGLFDVATYAGLEKHDEDFGQTLAVWGVGEGAYLVLPVLGPSNLRDGFGLIPDWELYPPTYIKDDGTYYGLLAVELVNRRTQLLDASDILEQAAGQDPYVFVREAYRQRRHNLVYDGNPPTLPPDPSLFEDDPPAASKEGAPKKSPATDRETGQSK
jgi:phospholipid-binding lipoprotein MlaA